MQTILFYTNKKEQETLVIENMFKDIRKEELFPVWKMEYKYLKDIKKINYDVVDINKAHVDAVISEVLNSEKITSNDLQIIIYGIDKGVSKIINHIHSKYEGITIKLISNTYEGLIFYDYERKNFFKCLELLKENKIKKMYFMKKGIVSAYKNLGYNVEYLMQNYKLDESTLSELKIKKEKLNKSDKTIIGAYPQDSLWNNNVYNTLSVAKFIDNSILRYNVKILRDYEFVKTQEINSIPVYLNVRNEKNIAEEIIKNDVVLDLDFTNNFNLTTLLAIELEVPFIVGNNMDLFKDLKIDKNVEELVVTNSEDNPYTNSQKLETLLSNENVLKDTIAKLVKWKKEYNKIQQENFEKMLND